MDWGIFGTASDSFWVDVFSKLTLISAAGFGLLGLFTDYKKDGKVTRWGQLAAAGIISSTMLSVATGVFEGRIKAGSNAVEAERRKKLDENLSTQLAELKAIGGTLGQVSEDNRDIAHSMELSNAKQAAVIGLQNALLGRAEQSMLLTARLSGEGRSNTGRVLKGLWDEANRISGEKIEILLQVECDATPGRPAVQLAFDNAAFVGFVLQTPDEVERGQTGMLSGWEALGALDRTLFSYSSKSIELHIDGRSRVTSFKGFFAFSPDTYSHPNQWRNFSPAFFFNAPVTGRIAEQLSLNDYAARIAAVGPGKPVELPCEATWSLMVAGRALGDADAPLFYSVGKDGVGELKADSKPVPLEYDQLPVFAAATDAANSKAKR